MVLAIDIGNTNVVLGGYQHHCLKFTTRFATERNFEADQYALEISGVLRLYEIDPKEITGVVISSVVPSVTTALVQAVKLLVPVSPILLDALSDTGIRLCIDNPAELGADIVASAIAVKNSGVLPAVVIDMGTATTLTALDKNGDVQGVAIMPGVFISLEALTGKTSLLQSIALEAPTHAIGKNTIDSMKSGVLLGAAAMLDGMLERFRQELVGEEPCSFIATGGIAELVLRHCKQPVTLQDNLLLDGLYQFYLQQTEKHHRQA